MSDHYQDTIRLAQLIGLDYQYDETKRVVERFVHQWVPWRPFENERDLLPIRRWLKLHYPTWNRITGCEGERDHCETFCRAVLKAFGEPEPEPVDTRGPAIVACGSISSGFSFHGPFPTVDAAAEWLAGQTVFAGSVILPEPVGDNGLTPAESEIALAELAERLKAMTYRKEQERLLREEAWGQAARYRDECDKKLKALRGELADETKRLRGEIKELTHQHATQLDNVVRLTAEVDRLRVTRIRRWRNWL